jgi:signal peptidase I
MAAIIVMAAIGAWAIITGQISYVVTYGVSMNPVYYRGDLVFVMKENSYQVGQIVAYHGIQPGQKVLHRIVGGDATSGFIFKGDNNQSIDPVRPTGDRLIGRAFLHVPKGGLILGPLLSPTGLGMLGFLLFGGAAAGARNRREIARGRRKKKVKAMARQGGPQAVLLAAMRAFVRLSPPLRAATAASAALAIGGLALGVLGWIKPVTTVRNTGGEEQSIVFSYSARVPRSPAYDSTEVTSPEPIFRKITNHVDVQIHYHGRPGTLTVNTELQATSGWHTTVVSLAPTRFAGDDQESTIALDLRALEQRVTTAAKAIGLDPGQVQITVRPRVVNADGDAFSAALPLTLSPMTLTLGSAGGLKNTSDGGHEVVNRTINVFGHPAITAARARSDAMLLLVLSAIGLVLVVVAARRGQPANTRSEIERRFPQLLVHVEPMPSPPGKPVVNVDNFPALVKLAERYGQMILTWRRPDADDFVVRDEGITYRYRVPLDEPTLQNVELIDRPSGAGSHRRKATSEVS